MKILVVCGNGLGSSLIMEMNIKEILQKLQIQAEVNHEDFSSASSSQADIFIAAKDMALHLQEMDKSPVLALTNIFDKAEIEKKLLPLINR